MEFDKGTVLLSGIVGSTAYGLAHEGSDIDRLGIYAAPTVQFHGLRPPIGRQATTVLHEPDVTLHEIGKFAALCLNCNPSVMELLWLEDYEILTPSGKALIAIRSAFLSAKRVRDAYMGYATQQLTRLSSKDFHGKDPDKIAKHARHILRLANQGMGLYETGELRVRLDDPEEYFDFGRQVAQDGSRIAAEMLATIGNRFNLIIPKVPGRPDDAVVEDWLINTRALHYERNNGHG
jgi:predicted nucleotidyltransferase